MGEARAELVVRRHVEADITARCCLSLSGSCAWECGSPSPRCCSADVALGRRTSVVAHLFSDCVVQVNSDLRTVRQFPRFICSR